MAELPPDRQSTRLRGYNYAGSGTYFITVCTADRWHFFGQVVERTMHRSDWGEIAAHEWLKSLARRPNIVPHAFIVMPNHVHGLISFDPESTPERGLVIMARGMPPQSLGRFLNGYKGAVTSIVRRLINDPHFDVWQRNYHDRVVRDEREFEAVREYILENAGRWEKDRFNANHL